MLESPLLQLSHKSFKHIISTTALYEESREIQSFVKSKSLMYIVQLLKTHN